MFVSMSRPRSGRQVGLSPEKPIRDADQFLDVGDAGVEQLALVAVEFDLDHFLDTARAKYARHADEVAADAVLLLAEGGAG